MTFSTSRFKITVKCTDGDDFTWYATGPNVKGSPKETAKYLTQLAKRWSDRIVTYEVASEEDYQKYRTATELIINGG